MLKARMVVTQDPLSSHETERLMALFQRAGARGLAFARGVFAATATAPSKLAPEEWLPLVLGTEQIDPSALRELLGLVMREYNACAQCLTLGVPAVPEATQEADIAEFCKGYVQIAQRDRKWTTDPESFEKTAPLMVLSGYGQSAGLEKLAPEAATDLSGYLEKHQKSLIDDVASLYAHFADAREKEAQPKQKPTVSDKIGRNDPCPCGSGKKYKKCCGKS